MMGSVALVAVGSHDLATNCMDPWGCCVEAVAVARSRIEPLELAAAVAAEDDPCVAFAFDDFVKRFDEWATFDCGALAYSYYCIRFDSDSVAICIHSEMDCMFADMATIVALALAGRPVVVLYMFVDLLCLHLAGLITAFESANLASLALAESVLAVGLEDSEAIAVHYSLVELDFAVIRCQLVLQV